MAGGVKTPTAGVKDVEALGVVQLRRRLYAVRGDRDEHHVRVSGGEFADRQLADDGVGGRDDPMQELSLLDVQLYRTLVGVQVGEHRTALRSTAIADERCHRPGGATTRAFDFDHLGAEVGEKLPAVFSGNRFGQLDDPDTSQRRHAIPRDVRAWRAPSGSGATPAGS